MLDSVSTYLTLYGYYFLFFATLIESVPFIGLFFPGEVIVVAAGFFAARGDLALLPVLIVASVGGIVGSNIGYALGYWGGRPLIDRWAHRFNVTEEHIKFAEDYFERHGSKTVFFGRYVAGLKAFITALAGTTKMEYGIFFIYAAAGIISWTLLAGLLGFFFGQYIDVIVDIIKAIGWVSLVIMLLVFVIAYWWRRKKQEKN